MLDPLLLGGIVLLIALVVAAILLPKQRKWLLGGGGVVLAGILARVLDLVLRRKPATLPPKVTPKDHREESSRNEYAVDDALAAQADAADAAQPHDDPPVLSDLERRAREAAAARRDRGDSDPA